MGAFDGLAQRGEQLVAAVGVGVQDCATGRVLDRGAPTTGGLVVVGQIPAEGVRAGVQPGLAQLFAWPQHQSGGCGVGGGRTGARTAGAGLEGGVALGAVAGQQLVQPGAGDAARGDDLGRSPAFDLDRGEVQPGLRQDRASAGRPGCPDNVLRKG